MYPDFHRFCILRNLKLVIIVFVFVAALRIHISKLTFLSLSEVGVYEMMPRGEMNIKVINYIIIYTDYVNLD